VLADPRTRTRDIGGTLGTDAFADAVCKAIEAGAS
jgi:isocitrate/isopropylmalate dehydrogenase